MTKRFILASAALLLGPISPSLAADPAPTAPAAADALVEAFKSVETGSVADAIEQLYGIKTFMSHEMRPIQEDRFVGRAVTVQFKQEEHKEGAPAIAGMMTLLDSSPPGSVYVMALENGRDYGAIGGMMATTMKVRGFAGAISDGGVRDLGQIKKIGLPVWGRSIVPSTTVNHYRFAAANVPVTVGGVRVEQGDIIVADSDGIVVVPKDKAAAILTRSQANDLSEHATLPLIEKFKSLKQAVDTNGRI
jgi:4-hydroxy-4-methyl-2-oxoglutarate aldolase